MWRYLIILTMRLLTESSTYMLGHTKIGKFDITIRVNKYVCPFDIPVRKGKFSLSVSHMQLHERVKDSYILKVMTQMAAIYLCTVFRPCKYARPERICAV